LRRPIKPLSFRTEQTDASAFPIPSEESVGLRSEKSLFDVASHRPCLKPGQSTP